MSSLPPDSEPSLPGPRPRRAATWRGRPAARPAGAYDPDPAVRDAADGSGLEVRFAGEDGRAWAFSFAALPLPGWHADLAAAFVRLTGPTGSRRTLRSARDVWDAQGRLLRFLSDLPHPPRDATYLALQHLRGFQRHRQQTCKPRSVPSELRNVRQLLDQVNLQQRLRPDVVEWLGHRWPEPRRHGVPGYSEQEFRRIMAAARSDVAAIRDRIRASERLLARAEREPATLTAAERTLAAGLQAIARTGRVPPVQQPGRKLRNAAAMVELAGRLFLVDADLAPLLVLGAGITGRNPETLKELPADHELLEGRAVRLELIKRRRGPNHAFEVVHWDVGPPSRQLHTPGGYYLLLQELTRRGRAFSGSASVWSIWNAQSRHVSPFARTLSRQLYLNAWASRHGLRDDDGQPLAPTLNRLRTTVQVRTTKAVGGHLPTAARTNTMDVLFGHYLRGDPTVIEWAASEVSAAVVDAEQHARQAHLRVLTGPVQQHTQDLAATAARLDVTPETARQALAGELDTLVAACLDIDHSPFNPGHCQASFLVCLRCPNALVTHRHLPGLLALVERLDFERQTTDAQAWWARHGRTWLAITEDVLPKFTPAELDHASAAAAPTASLLDLLVDPKEQS